MAWLMVLLLLAAAVTGTLASGLVRKLAWTAAALLAVWAAWKAWSS